MPCSNFTGMGGLKCCHLQLALSKGRLLMNKLNPFQFIQGQLQDKYRRVIYFPNPGNLGDALIAAATVQQFEKYGIEYSIASNDYFKKFDPSFLYVYGGGGNLIPAYPSCRTVLERLSSVGATAIVLPHSTYGMDQLLSGYGGELFFFCRERPSFRRVSASINQGGAYLYDDVALSLDLSDTRFSRLKFMRKMLRQASQSRPDPVSGEGGATLFAFRKDGETTGIAERLSGLGRPNFDLSSSLPTKGVVQAFLLNTPALFDSISWFLSYISTADKIYSDRLHVCIAALLLGKKVYAYDNNYGKLNAVANFSLKKRFSNRLTVVQPSDPSYEDIFR